MTRHTPSQPFPVNTAWPGKMRSAGAPLALLIALGTLVGLIVILITASNPQGAAVGFFLTTIAIAVVLMAYVWLDRWEPEPPRLLAFAFLWGASVAVVISVVLEVVAESLVNPAANVDSVASPITVVLGAPLIEEAAKGMFLLIMMTGRRRNELNSLTDCLVYAGVTAAGFAWVEDAFYIANGETMAASLVTAAMRLIMAPFAHPLFTTLTGIGVYFALRRHGFIAKAGCILLGYAGAVLMHGLWNGSALMGAKVYLGLYFAWMVPIFVLVVALALYSRRREQQVVAEKLPGMVAAGLATPQEAAWLGSIRQRRLAVAAAKRFGGKPAAWAVGSFAAHVVDLAFVRDRIDRGFGDARIYALLNEHTQDLYVARATAAPALQGLAAYHIPGR